MSAKALRFGRIGITHMPGIGSPGFTVSDLDGSINILFGPNAVGKSTTATALRALLWPAEAPDTAIVDGIADIDGEAFELKLNANRLDVSPRAGWPQMPPSDSADRYILALHDLIKANDEHFAKHVQREVAGGYDIEAARKELGLREAPKRANAKPVADARRVYDKARREQESLLMEEESLDKLRRTRERAQTIARQAEPVRHALRYRGEREKAATCLAELRRFPHWAPNMHGDELGAFQFATKTRDGRLGDLREAWSLRRAAQARRRQQRLLQHGISDVNLTAIRELSQTLRRREDAILPAERELASAEQAEEQARNKLAGIPTQAQLDAIDGASIDDLIKLVHEADRLAIESSQLDTARSLWECDPPALPVNTLQQAEAYLVEWLSLPTDGPPAGRRQEFGLVAAVIAAAAAAVGIVGFAVVTGRLAWLLLLLPVLAYAAWLLWSAARSAGEQPRRAIQLLFDKLDVEKPREWTNAAVSDLLNVLRIQICQAREQEEKARRWRDFATRLVVHEKALVEFEQRRSHFLASCGFAPGVEAPPLPRLYAYIASIIDWRHAKSRLHQASAELDETRKQQLRCLALFNETVEAYGERAETAEQAAGIAQSLGDRSREWHAAVRQVASEAVAVRSAASVIKQQETTRKAILSRLGLTEGDETAVREAASIHAGYVQSLSSFRESKAVLRQIRRSLGPEDRALIRRDTEKLRTMLEDATAAGSEAERLLQQITRIETQISDARASTGLEEKIAAVQDAIDKLADDRDSQYGPLVGNMLASHIAKQSRAEDRPPVFRRANEIFLEITHGEFSLDFDEGEPPAFRAIDEHTGVRCKLDNLSSGTRVQVLIAVRLAFIEAQETDVMLPLIVDEVLANSDDHRAPKIVDALYALARRGRQIFYLTAQQHEVEHWQQSAAGLHDFKLIDMAEVRGREAFEQRPRRQLDRPLIALPDPDRLSPHEYGSLISAPSLDPSRPIGYIDICDLADEARTVVALRKLNIDTWARLRPFLDRYSDTVISRREAQRMAAKASVLDSILRDWQIGRSRKLHYSDLRDSGAITNAFEDRIRELVEQVHGDGHALVEKLSQGEVKGFRSTSLDTLREFCIKHGYLADIAPLSLEEIQANAFAAAHAYLVDRLLSAEDIEQLLALMPTDDGNSSPPATAAAPSAGVV